MSVYSRFVFKKTLTFVSRTQDRLANHLAHKIISREPILLGAR